jgi:hypothetical protein
MEQASFIIMEAAEKEGSDGKVRVRKRKTALE